MTEPTAGPARSGPAARPLLTVVRGEPTAEELAALIAVVSTRAASGAAADEEPTARSLWSTPVLRAPLHHGPGAWRASGLARG